MGCASCKEGQLASSSRHRYSKDNLTSYESGEEYSGYSSESDGSSISSAVKAKHEEDKK
jgi:hypothetical protein